MKPLVIFEMANNHMGSLTHAKSIISRYYQLTKNFKDKIDFAIKFQYRDAKTFIHESLISSTDTQIQRFKTTFLPRSSWNKIIQFSKNKFKLICTPFDEISVDNVIKDKYDYLKIASCSATDWPLLETIAKKIKKGKIICSLGGTSEDEISTILSFFATRKINAQFLYCVAKYPSSPDDLNLIYFNELRSIYGDKIAGISLHEDPSEYLSGALGYSMGARIFEKHIGLPTKNIKNNKYSVDLKQMEKWLKYLSMSIEQVGSIKDRKANISFEKKQLQGFQRGVYLKNHIAKKSNARIKNNDVSFHFPRSKGQLAANDYSMFSEFMTKKEIHANNPILVKDLNIKNVKGKIIEIRNKVRDLAARSNIIVPRASRIEISHHYGLDNFYKHGLSMIEVVNQSYCKKYLFIFKNQVHPPQFHKKKNETFLILFGKIELIITIDKKVSRMILTPGQIYTIEPMMIHEFKALSTHGAIIEEISTESIRSDSYYLDKSITRNKNRKTMVSFY